MVRMLRLGEGESMPPDDGGAEWGSGLKETPGALPAWRPRLAGPPPPGLASASGSHRVELERKRGRRMRSCCGGTPVSRARLMSEGVTCKPATARSRVTS